MADDSIDQRLAALEAAISTLATKTDLEGVAKNVDIQALQHLVERQNRLIENHRATLELRYQMVQLQLQHLTTVPSMLERAIDLLRTLADRVVDLENRKS